MAESKIQKAYVVGTTSAPSDTLASGGGKTFTADATKTGYKPIGIIGYKTGVTAGTATVYVAALYIDGNSAKAFIRNASDGNITLAPEFYVLYEKA